jgi:tRNA pseudouridine55 synthase
MRKRYRATFLLGHTSESDDTERELVAIPNAVVPTLDQINAALPQFVGDIQQRPPAHSAIKIGGKRAYKLARKGADFELPERTITVYQINILRYEYPALEIDVECGSGTYIRSLGRDLGAALGTGGVMSALERTATGPFKVADAIRPDDLSVGSIAKRLQPAQLAVAHMPQTTVTDAELVEIRNGRPIALRPAVAHQPEWAGIDTAGELAAILHSKRGQLWPTHNFSA